MKLFVGLGNPGTKYERNRHNVGFLMLDRLADDYATTPWKRKFQGLIADASLGGERALFIKPQTYMNESGRSVGEAARFLKIPTEDIIVLYDEIDLAPGKLKVKTGGGNAGHNGLKSLSAHIGNDYVRVRIGVGHPGDRAQVANYVLSDFSKADRTWLDPMIDEISRAAHHLAKGDPSHFLNDVMKALAPEQPKKTNNKPQKKSADEPATSDAKPEQRSPPAKTEEKPKTGSALFESLKAWRAKSNDDKS